jgi:hypothetical protein
MKSSQKTRPARPVVGEGFIRFHLWACGEPRKGSDARARRARGKRPRRLRKDRGVEAQATGHTGHPQELRLLENKAVELDIEDPAVCVVAGAGSRGREQGSKIRHETAL